jgi:G3E family GTPase
VNGAGQLDRHIESVKQVAVADRLVVTKTDLAEPAGVAALLARVRSINPAAPLAFAADPSLDASTLLSDGAFAIGQRGEAVTAWFAAASVEHHHAEAHDRNRHGHDIRAFALSYDRPLDWTVFGIWLTMLLNRHGEAVLRVKGILDLDGVSAPVAVHGVQHLVHPPVHMRAWPDTERRSRIVFIVKGLDPAAIERSLSGFMALAGGAKAVAA